MSGSRHLLPKDWQDIRKSVIRRDKGLCQPCLKQGVRTPGEQVHHVIPVRRGGDHELKNLVYICGTCHAFERTDILYRSWSKKICKHKRRFIHPKRLKRGIARAMKVPLCNEGPCRQQVPSVLMKYRSSYYA